MRKAPYWLDMTPEEIRDYFRQCETRWARFMALLMVVTLIVAWFFRRG